MSVALAMRSGFIEVSDLPPWRCASPPEDEVEQPDGSRSARLGRAARSIVFLPCSYRSSYRSFSLPPDPPPRSRRRCCCCRRRSHICGEAMKMRDVMRNFALLAAKPVAPPPSVFQIWILKSRTYTSSHVCCIMDGFSERMIEFAFEGPMHPAMSAASWMDSVNEFEAGTRACLLHHGWIQPCHQVL